MKIFNALIGGLAGAAAVTIIHEILRKNFDDTPRLDLLGEEAMAKVIESTGNEAPAKEKLYAPTLTADLLSNAFYYGLATASAKNPLTAGLIAGASAGLGSIKLPEPLGLNPEHTNSSSQKQGITMLLYTFGGVLAGVIVRALSGKKSTAQEEQAPSNAVYS